MNPQTSLPLAYERVAVVLEGQPLLQDIDLAVARGELLAVLGPNGAGKSTLLRCGSGGCGCSDGQVQLHGTELGGTSYRERARQLAVLPQQSALEFPLNVYDVVELGRLPHQAGRAQDCLVVERLLQLFDLVGLAGRPYTQLSGGEKQRVQLARVIAQVIATADLEVIDGAVLLLDEPVAALDLLHQRQLMELLRQLCAQGLSVLMVLHDINVAAAYADRLVFLKNGRLVASVTPEQAMDTALLGQVYDTDLRLTAPDNAGRRFVFL